MEDLQMFQSQVAEREGPLHPTGQDDDACRGVPGIVHHAGTRYINHRASGVAAQCLFAGAVPPQSITSIPRIHARCKTNAPHTTSNMDNTMARLGSASDTPYSEP
jgi:hypothetical protein